MHKTVVIAVAGGGPHARVVYEAAVLSRLPLAGFVTAEPQTPTDLIDGPHLGGEELLSDHVFVSRYKIVPATGSNAARRQISQSIRRLGGELATVIHPNASISPSAELGAGSVVLAGAIVGTSARIGEACIVNHGASVDHDCRIGQYVNICPGARLAGSVVVGDECFIGLNASIIQGIEIGVGATIGAGAVVIRRVPSEATAVGNPARLISERGGDDTHPKR